MQTPRFNYFRDLVWRNPSVCQFAAILFERRLVPQLHTIPIIDFADLDRIAWRNGKTFLAFTLNKPLLDECTRRLSIFGIEPCGPAKLMRVLVAAAPTTGLCASPFAEIAVSEICELATVSMNGHYERLTSRRSIDLARSLKINWQEYAWDGFFNFSSDVAPDSPLAEWIDEYYARGVRNFVVGRSKCENMIDLVTHFGALHRSSDYRVWTLAPLANTERARLHHAVMRSRLATLPTSSDDPALNRPTLFIADSLSEWFESTSSVPASMPRAGAIVRLRKNLVDLVSLISSLDTAALRDKIDLRLHSADPSYLFAHVFPVY